MTKYLASDRGVEKKHQTTQFRVEILATDRSNSRKNALKIADQRNV